MAQAGDLPVMIYSNRVAYRVDVTPQIMEELAADARFVAIKESSDDIRRTTEIINRLGDRYACLDRRRQPRLRGAGGRRGRLGGGAGLRFPEGDRRHLSAREARAASRRRSKIYRWFRPMLDLDVSTYLVQNIKLAEVLAIGTNDRVRMPRQPLSGELRAKVEKIVRDAIAVRPSLPSFA